MRASSPRFRRIPSALVVALYLAGGHAAPAHAAPDPPAFDAEDAFRQGLERHRKGDALGAVEIWTRIVSTLGEERAYKVLYNLGVAHQQLGEITRAVQRFEAFLRILGVQPEPVRAAASAQREDAEARLAAIRAAYGLLSLRAPEGGELVLVRVGGGAPEPAGLVRWLAPGGHDIELYSGTSRAEKRHVHLAGGETIVIATTATAPLAPSVVAPPVLVPAAPPTTRPLLVVPPPPADPPRASPLPWLLGGLGATAASFALPLSLRAHALSVRGDAEGIPTSDSAYPGAVEDYESARRGYYLSYALPATLAVATVVAVVVTATRGSAPRPKAPPPSGEGSKRRAITARRSDDP
ncbi:MAG: hypothetical protein U0359_09535 [Byssovorax sp.]